MVVNRNILNSLEAIVADDLSTNTVNNSWQADAESPEDSDLGDTSRLEIFRPNQKDFERMKYYYEKASSPIRLVATIRNPIKLIRRCITANIMEWKEAAHEFALEIVARRKLMTGEMLCKLVNFFARLGGENVPIAKKSRLEQRVASDYITNSSYQFFASLSGYTAKWISAFQSPLTDEGKRMSGSYEVEGFSVDLTNDETGETTTIDFDIVKKNNYIRGYILDNYLVNLRNFKSVIKEILRR